MGHLQHPPLIMANHAFIIVGIAGITIYGPEIFTIAGIAAKDRQWVSGLNDITYMVRVELSPARTSSD